MIPSPEVAAYLLRMAPTQSHALRREFQRVARALDPPTCVRCGNQLGAGGHGPGFCPDRRASDNLSGRGYDQIGRTCHVLLDNSRHPALEGRGHVIEWYREGLMGDEWVTIKLDAGPTIRLPSGDRQYTLD